MDVDTGTCTVQSVLVSAADILSCRAIAQELHNVEWLTAYTVEGVLTLKPIKITKATATGTSMATTSMLAGFTGLLVCYQQSAAVIRTTPSGPWKQDLSPVASQRCLRGPNIAFRWVLLDGVFLMTGCPTGMQDSMQCPTTDRNGRSP